MVLKDEREYLMKRERAIDELIYDCLSLLDNIFIRFVLKERIYFGGEKS